MQTQTFHFEVPSDRQDIIAAFEAIMKAFNIANEIKKSETSKALGKDRADRFKEQYMSVFSTGEILSEDELKAFKAKKYAK